MENRAINPAPPALTGLAWREISPYDLASCVELAVECQLADGGLAFLNEPENLSERYFPDAPGAAVGAFAGEHLVACATVHVVGEPDDKWAKIVGQVRPDFRNRGIGTFLMLWSQAQAVTLSSSTAVHERLLQIATESLTESARRLYHAHGFKSVFEELVMRRDLNAPLPDLPLPPYVTIVSWEPALAHRFFLAYQAAFRERPGFPGFTANEWIARWNDDENAKAEWSLLARVDEAPVGFVTASAEHSGGYIMQVGVIPEQRRRGLASALMVETMRRMRAAGAAVAQVTVHLNNPGAIQTYVRLGFAEAGRRARYERTAEQ